MTPENEWVTALVSWDSETLQWREYDPEDIGRWKTLPLTRTAHPERELEFPTAWQSSPCRSELTCTA